MAHIEALAGTRAPGLCTEHAAVFADEVILSAGMCCTGQGSLRLLGGMPWKFMLLRLSRQSHVGWYGGYRSV